MSALSTSQKTALNWLFKRGGDAAFDRNGVAMASGESAPVLRTTWNKLAVAGLIRFYGGKRDGGKGYGRLCVTDEGRTVASAFDPDRRGFTHSRQPRRPLMVDDDPSEFFA